MTDTDDRARDAAHHLNLWLCNDQPVYRQARALLAKHRDPDRLKVWVGDILYGPQPVHTALCRNTAGYGDGLTNRYAQTSWDVLTDTRQRVSRVVFERIGAAEIASMLDSDNELGWEKDHGEQ
jgi:hypothetical protein